VRVGLRNAWRSGGELDEPVAEVETAEDRADDRHDQVVHERIDDLAEGRADDDTDSEVHYVAFDCELPEFGKHAHECSSKVHADAGAMMRERSTDHNPRRKSCVSTRSLLPSFCFPPFRLRNRPNRKKRTWSWSASTTCRREARTSPRSTTRAIAGSPTS